MLEFVSYVLIIGCDSSVQGGISGDRGLCSNDIDVFDAEIYAYHINSEHSVIQVTQLRKFYCHNSATSLPKEKRRDVKGDEENDIPSAKCPLAVPQVFASAADEVVPAAICTRACNNLSDFSTAAIHEHC